LTKVLNTRKSRNSTSAGKIKLILNAVLTHIMRRCFPNDLA
jgi:hypothetical protein